NHTIDQRHPADTPDWWRSLGSNAPAVIIQMYKDTTSVYRKSRLVQGLAWFDDSAAADFVKEVAETTDNSVLRQAAIKTYGITNGDKDTDSLAKFLNHADQRTR